MSKTREIEVLIYDNGLRNSIQRFEKENEWINVHSPLCKKAEANKNMSDIVCSLDNPEACEACGS